MSGSGTAPSPDLGATGGDGTCMVFVGVSTSGSSIRRVFPSWAHALGLPTDVLSGRDVPLGASDEDYRALVTSLHDDPSVRGALVTTHKVGVHRAAADLFDELDPLAQTFGEISSIYRRDGRWCGAAKDPVTVRLALEELVAPDHFSSTGGEVLVLGSGGSGMALSHQLGERGDAPARVTCTALRQDQLDHLRELHERSGLAGDLYRYALTPDPADADALVSSLPPASLVVNATGLGKDRRGSPVTDAVVFPEGGLVWDFNYRGSLEMVAQAQAQRHERNLVVEDGWRYFVHGWSSVVADVFDVPMPHERVEELSAVAARSR